MEFPLCYMVEFIFIVSLWLTLVSTELSGRPPSTCRMGVALAIVMTVVSNNFKISMALVCQVSSHLKCMHVLLLMFVQFCHFYSTIEAACIVCVLSGVQVNAHSVLGINQWEFYNCTICIHMVQAVSSSVTI